METKNILLQLIPQQKILPLYFYKDEEVTIEVLKILYKTGIRAVEYTNRGDAALNNFKKMREVCDATLHGMYIGAGTIKNATAAYAFINAGADFIISPGLIDEVASVADKKNMLWIPGCMSTSEIIRAENSGAKMIKLFPGNILGAGFVSAIKDIFPDLIFMPTGGVDLSKESMEAWFKAGVAAVGLGSKLISKDLLEQKNYKKIEALTTQAIELANSIK